MLQLLLQLQWRLDEGLDETRSRYQKGFIPVLEHASTPLHTRGDMDPIEQALLQPKYLDSSVCSDLKPRRDDAYLSLPYTTSTESLRQSKWKTLRLTVEDHVRWHGLSKLMDSASGGLEHHGRPRTARHTSAKHCSSRTLPFEQTLSASWRDSAWPRPMTRHTPQHPRTEITATTVQPQTDFHSSVTIN